MGSYTSEKRAHKRRESCIRKIHQLLHALAELPEEDLNRVMGFDKKRQTIKGPSERHQRENLHPHDDAEELFEVLGTSLSILPMLRAEIAALKNDPFAREKPKIEMVDWPLSGEFPLDPLTCSMCRKPGFLVKIDQQHFVLHFDKLTKENWKVPTCCIGTAFPSDAWDLDNPFPRKIVSFYNFRGTPTVERVVSARSSGSSART